MLNKIMFYFTPSKNQEKKFSPKHIRYNCKIKYNNLTLTAPYQTALGRPLKEEFIQCLILDAESYEANTDYIQFCKEFGYDDIKEGKKVYNACKRESERIHKLFTDEEIAEINKELVKKWYNNKIIKDIKDL